MEEEKTKKKKIEKLFEKDCYLLGFSGNAIWINVSWKNDEGLILLKVSKSFTLCAIFVIGNEEHEILDKFQIKI